MAAAWERGSGRVALDRPLSDDIIRRKAAELEAVFEALTDGLLVIDAGGHIVEANRAAIEMLGHAQKLAVLGPLAQGFYARVTRPDGAPVSGDDLGIRAVLRGGEPAPGECVVRPEHGGPRWLELVTSPIRDGAGTVLGAAAVARDITRQRRRERDLSLLASASNLLLAAPDVPAAAGSLANRCIEDLADWCAVYVADPGSEILRPLAVRQRGGVIDAEVARLLAQRPPRIGEGFGGNAMRAGEAMLLPELAETSIRRHGGAGAEAQIARRIGLRALVAAPIPGATGPIGALCVGWNRSPYRPDRQDVALIDELARRAGLAIEQERCLQGLAEALSRLELVLDSAGAGLLIFGGDGRAILVNAPARAVLGLHDDGVGRTLTDMLDGAIDTFLEPRELDELMAAAVDRGATSQGTFRISAASPIDVDWLATPVRDLLGPLPGLFFVWFVVREIRAAERIKDELAGDINDAIRAPLQAISTQAAQALRRARRGSQDPTLAHGLEVILRHARQASMHLSDLVDAARFDATALSVDTVDVTVADVIQQAVDQARAMTAVHRFRVDVPPGLPPARWDPARVRQALLHLLMNAIKYWPEGGQIGVKVRPQVDGVVISVRDRGLGIPPDDHERVFERFFRCSADPAHRRIRGNGLGLYLVRGIVDAHAGSIWIESAGTPGEGTTVHVLLPWQRPAPARR